MAAAHRASDNIPFAKLDGMPYLPAAGAGGVGIQVAKIAQVGASPFTVTLATYGLSDMENGDYYVSVQDVTAGVFVPVSAHTVSSFVVTGGSAADDLRVFICGRLKGQAG